jgi:hypothetical protein
MPTSHEILTAAFLPHDGSIRLPSRQSQDHPSTAHFSGLHRSRSRHPFQFPPLMRRNFSLVAGTHLVYQISALEINDTLH